MNFKVINCGEYIYISQNERYQNSLDGLIFDGKEAEKTKKQYWYKLPSIPTKIEKKRPNERINKRYELKAGYVATEIMPQIITMDMYDSDEYEDVIGLYSLRYEEQDGGYDEVDFKIDVIYERKDFEFVPNKYNADVDLLTQIEYPEESYQDMPCQVNSRQMFEIIRQHVKSHIDMNFAKIKSDYDFHFELIRYIGLNNPYTKMVDTNNSLVNKRRKPKWVERTVTTKEVTILNIKRDSSDKRYGDDCQIAPTITGENYQELTDKIEKYLEELMKTINKNYCECPKCNGWGIVEVEECQ